jgi:hypothetical protein
MFKITVHICKKREHKSLQSKSFEIIIAIQLLEKEFFKIQKKLLKKGENINKENKNTKYILFNKH